MSTFKLILFISAVALFYNTPAQINFPPNSAFYYLKGKDAEQIPNNWMTDQYNHTSWKMGNAPFWYGDGNDGTEVNDMRYSYSTFYIKGQFEVNNAPLIKDILLSLNYDDGFVVWINGNEVSSNLAPVERLYDAFATANHESGEWESFQIDANDVHLKEGSNTIAVQVFNVSLQSSDFHINLSIQGNAELPELPETMDTLGLTFSHPSGFYRNNFDLTISHPDANMKIVYTMDGSNPQTSNSAITTNNNTTTLRINPSSSTGRPRSPGFVVRASVVQSEHKPSKPTARTFLYLDKVMTQTSPGGAWPDQNVNGQIIDNDVDTEVTQSAQYKDLMHLALTDIPSISITTDIKNLFDAQTGIYVNADQQGMEWERDCSVELLDYNGEDGFNVNAGLRIRGGWSRHDNFPKHSFRLFFRNEYGNAKLKYPLFEDEGVDQFDKIDLRCAQNYGWQNNSGQHNTFLREVFTRDAQGETGNPYTRSRYYHLYLNGMYWGLYMTQERSEARYAADYLEGSASDFDVVKVSGENYSKQIEATDGNLDGWQRIWNMCQKGFSNDQDYFAIEGKDKNGNRDPNLEVLVNIDNLIDYMINIIYTGNFDSPVSAFGSNKNANNFYAINNRNDPDEGFQFFVHDGEHSLAVEPSGPGIGLYENRADIGVRTDNTKMVVNDFSSFHPQWLHQCLSANANYRMRFTDRAQKQLTGNGIFTPEANKKRLEKRFAQIEYAIIGESARWGDSNKSTPYTKDNAWLPEVNQIFNTYFPQRTNIVIDQLKQQDLFSSVAIPSIKFQGRMIDEQIVMLEFPDKIQFINASSGLMVYTTNGQDPRLLNGELNRNATVAKNGEDLMLTTSTQIKVRVLQNSKWSALKEVYFLEDQIDFAHFKVTELHYHPLKTALENDTISNTAYEFIEFKNTSYQDAINLSGVTIDSAVRYTFPNGTILDPQEFYVIASKPRRFRERYQMDASGNFKKFLSNSGEKVQLSNAHGEIIMSFTYSDQEPWPMAPDGTGPSLVSRSVNPTGDPNDPEYWFGSWTDHGSPFANDTTSIYFSPSDVPIAEVPIKQLKLFPNPTNDLLYIRTQDVGLINNQARLVNMNGQTVSNFQLQSQTTVSFKALNLKAGVYFIVVEKPDGRTIEKIVFTP